MGRGGINKALVQRARHAIQARGGNPSIDAIRVELGNTGSKTTIHRYLKEIEGADGDGSAVPLSLSEQIANLVGQLADQLEADAQAVLAEEREQLTRERLDYQNKTRQAESRLQVLENQFAQLAEQHQIVQKALLQEQHQRHQVELENARLMQAAGDQQARLHDRDSQIRSLEDKHQHARDALDHYRQASKDQRDQEQRRHESRVQQTQMELRQLQQTLIIKQDELTQLNRDNARLIAEAVQQQRSNRALQQQLNQKIKAYEAAQIRLETLGSVNEMLEQRHQALQDKVAMHDEASTLQEEQTQAMRSELIEAIAKLKVFEIMPSLTSDGESTT
ncbi:cointegrate resolution protein T [Stutzerimonas zhaodongensis]|uniref:Cointegrate resolution protein T n=1 Tax=Stutzerimonas zhaodongensis TaxID=1176257 RepID=A0A365PRC7_9GAMM|nr:DNA-binding protein [Stutzerimonas zhaodongensis]RBA54695.1 cointegrate resolution protein T [Stutzerimonas zhaodongensis]